MAIALLRTKQSIRAVAEMYENLNRMMSNRESMIYKEDLQEIMASTPGSAGDKGEHTAAQRLFFSFLATGKNFHVGQKKTGNMFPVFNTLIIPL